MKDRLTFAPISNLLEGIKGFVVYCDASQISLGCVLIQHRKVIACASRQLKIHEKNNLTHDLGLAMVIFALTFSVITSMGVHMDVFTKHKSLKYMFSQRDLNLRQRK